MVLLHMDHWAEVLSAAALHWEVQSEVLGARLPQAEPCEQVKLDKVQRWRKTFRFYFITRFYFYFLRIINGFFQWQEECYWEETYLLICGPNMRSKTRLVSHITKYMYYFTYFLEAPSFAVDVLIHKCEIFNLKMAHSFMIFYVMVIHWQIRKPLP